MSLPNQLIPESQKDKKWMHKNGDAIVSMAKTTSNAKLRDRQCWRMYHEQYNESDYDYLRKVGDYEYPARVRWIGIVRPALNLLASQKSRRSLKFSTVAVDKRSVKEKQKKKLEMYLKKVKFKVDQVYHDIEQQMQKVNREIQKINQQLQQQPENEEMAQQLAQLQQVAPEIIGQLEFLNQQLTNELEITAKDRKEIDKAFKYDVKDLKEMLTQKGLKYLILKLEIEEASLDSFIDRMVTGKPYYFVDMEPGDKTPCFKQIDASKVYYPSDGNNRWVDQGSWVLIEEVMSYSQVIDQWGSEMSYDEKQMLRTYNYTDKRTANMLSVSGNGAIFDDSYTGNNSAGVYSGSSDNDQGITVYKYWWVSHREIKAKQTPNKKKPGKYFTHFVDDEFLEKYPVKKKKGEVLQKRYVKDTYQGVIIADSIYVGHKKKPITLRKEDNLSWVQLPVIGPAFNNISNQPYSLIWSTKDIQIMFNIVNFQKELLLTLSGVKGFVMDKSQIPEGMSVKEWIYYRKTGTGLIQTHKKGQRSFQFNQFQSYDDTISPAIQYLDVIGENLKLMVDEITGVSRQRRGDVKPTDQVGTFERSMEQSQLITEIMFHKHDKVDQRALTRLINLMNKVQWKQGDTFTYHNPDASSEIVNIPKGILDSTDIEVLLADSSKDEIIKRDIQQIAMRNHEKNVIDMSQLVKLMKIDSVIELEKTVDQFVEDAQEMAQMAQRNEADAKAAEIRLKGEIDQAIEAQKGQIEQMKIQVEQQKLALDERRLAQERELAEAKMQMENTIKMLDISSEREIESAYLQEQKRSSLVEENLKALQLKIDAILQANANDDNREQGIKKLEVENKKVSKEKVKD